MGKKKSKGIRSMKTKQSAAQEEDYKKAPHSFVFHRGHVGKNVLQLIKDMRQVMEPYTASRLQVKKKNILKDFVSIAGDLGVSHFLIYTKSEIYVHLRVCRLSRGPTLTFRVKEYALCKDVVSSLKRPNMDPKQFNHHPLLVMNNFSGDDMHMKLMSTMFQNMFPSININKVNLNNIKRCVMLNYNSEDKTIDFRHYNVRVVPVGMSKGVKKLIKGEIPDLSRYNDVSDFITRGGNLSESEAEMDGEGEVVLPQDIRSRGNIMAAKSAIRLTEVGPRMTLQLLKIEDGVCQGEVMYHELVVKTNKDKKDLKALRESKRKLKELRKRQQDENVQKKKLKKEDHKEKCLKGMKKGNEDLEKSELEDDDDYEDIENDDDDDDDAAYYEKEVGQAPDPDLFQRSSRKRKYTSKSPFPNKKRRPNSGERKGNKTDIRDSRKKNKGKFSGQSKKDLSWKTKGENSKHKNKPDIKKAKRSGQITKKPKFKAKHKGKK